MPTNRTTTETKKPLFKYVKEIFYWVIKGWPIILFSEFILFHALLLSIFPSKSHSINVAISSIYQLIGTGYIIVQIDENLKILKNIGLINSVKGYWKNKPKRIHTSTTVHLKADSINLTANITGTMSVKKSNPTLEEQIKDLTEKMETMDKKVDKYHKELSKKIRENKEYSSHNLRILEQEVKTISGNMTETIIGDYKKAILGILLISYGISVPVINLLKL